MYVFYAKPPPSFIFKNDKIRDHYASEYEPRTLNDLVTTDVWRRRVDENFNENKYSRYIETPFREISDLKIHLSVT